ncbi:uncharacterized protein LOC112569927 [Pomacea canaliculata]|uniref:uncharacterized protein LOC112569927 n=1 Tax=Pomacea canaliculata TaxID=400727 RepID=UPI000D72A926|nr:uncharacterized protein LOC112569927 [Pomacea canaliculata]XP_025103804.1 uncharacterized protein LOC112569927 [Pomacea canaliculata]XP_025103805.1 uncharacterized protein LOC112569927 [Pomacea canaliculata]XP_025103806.1 uncharacterized protein LOC112569927 [Pomacea canaliculata]XP_025103807.1 uncharacterized protein LOC112569927 [Pomacea canaliculata]
MFVTVKYGEEQCRIFNAICRNDLLLDSIRSQCQCDQNVVVDLSDERGEVKNLRCFPTSYGSDFLKERETLVLLRVDNDVHKETPFFTPLLNSLLRDQKFLDAINAQTEAEDSRDHRSRVKPCVSPDLVFAPVNKKPKAPKPTRMPVKK